MDYTTRELTIRELKIAYQEWGDPDGIPIIALHGFGLSGHMYDEFAKRLPDGYRLIALDQRGHGDSDWSPEGDYSRSAFVEDLENFRDSIGVDRFVLMGHSMGGLNAVSYAAKYPQRVEALVLVDVGPEAAKEGVDNIMRFTQGPDELEFEEFVEIAHRFNQRRSLDNIRDRMRHRLKKMESGKWTWKFDKRFREDRESLRIGDDDGTNDSWALFRAVQAPTLLIRGSESDVLTLGVAEQTASEMKVCRLVEVAGAGHSVPGDAPDAFTEGVEEFLSDVRDGKFAPVPQDDPNAPTLDELVEANGRRRPGIGAMGVIVGVVAAVVAVAAVLYLLTQRRKSRSARAQELARIRSRSGDVQRAATTLGLRGAGRARRAARRAHLGERGKATLQVAALAKDRIDRDRARKASEVAIAEGRRFGAIGLERSRGAFEAGRDYVAKRRRGRRRRSRLPWR